MRAIGFSTGSLALSDVRRALEMVRGSPATAIELSALRDSELVPLVEALGDLDLTQFSYVSFHAPSALRELTEAGAVSKLVEVAARGWPVVVHPDVIGQFDLWRRLGDRLLIENMDKRKRIGRTAAELSGILTMLPEAGLCFDIGHARQVDPSMCEADRILRTHGERVAELHVSDVNSQSIHEPLSLESILAFQRVAGLIPADAPVILETPVSRQGLASEIRKAHQALSRSAGSGVPALARLHESS